MTKIDTVRTKVDSEFQNFRTYVDIQDSACNRVTIFNKKTQYEPNQSRIDFIYYYPTNSFIIQESHGDSMGYHPINSITMFCPNTPKTSFIPITSLQGLTLNEWANRVIIPENYAYTFDTKIIESTIREKLLPQDWVDTLRQCNPSKLRQTRKTVQQILKLVTPETGLLHATEILRQYDHNVYRWAYTCGKQYSEPIIRYQILFEKAMNDLKSQHKL